MAVRGRTHGRKFMCNVARALTTVPAGKTLCPLPGRNRTGESEKQSGGFGWGRGKVVGNAPLRVKWRSVRASGSKIRCSKYD